MAQAGFHGVMGIYLAVKLTRGRFSSEVEDTGSRGVFGFGFILGNLLPDVDFFLLGPIYLFNSQLGLAMHRSWSHSVLTILLFAAILWLIAGRRAERGKMLALGVGSGMLLHALADMVVWFSSVDFLWPLGWLGIKSRVDLWAWYDPPRVVSNLLGAIDYLAFAVFFLYLGSLARKMGTNTAFLPRLRTFVRLNLALFVVYTVLSFFLGNLFDIAHYALFILIFFPMALYVTVKMRPTIEGYFSQPVRVRFGG